MPLNELYKRAIVPYEATIRQAMEAINNSALRICFICDEGRRVRGIATDGDIRRGLLAGCSLEDPVAPIMKVQFTHVINDHQYKHKAYALINEKNYSHIPVLDHEGHLVDIVFNSRSYKRERKDNAVVIMAGGQGMRLRPLTENCPKPLLKIGDKPILELIILNFKRYGFHKFFISVNYLAEQIIDYIGDGSRWEVEVEYIRENERLGTAGSLSLLPRQQLPFFVINGDLIVQADMDDILTQHKETGVIGTMGIKQYSTKVPYGVVQVEGRYITALIEKPTHAYFINAGLYCLNPEAVDLIPPGYYDMTSLFEAMSALQKKASAFLIEGTWIDIGNPEDYHYASENIAQLMPL